MFYAEYSQANGAVPPAYRGVPRKYGYIDRQPPTDPEAFERIRRDCGLSMSADLLSLCFAYLRKQAYPHSMETLYFLDRWSALYAERPETQALAGFDTDDPDHANALSALICRCRASHAVTPPLTLHSVLAAIHEDLAASLPRRPHDDDPAVHFRLCSATEYAALSAQGYAPSAVMDIGNTAWKLVQHAAHVEEKNGRPRRGDALYLLHGASVVPTFKECAAAQVFLENPAERRIRRILPVQPQMLLPAALSCVTGMTVHCTAFTTGGSTDDMPAPFPCDLLQSTPGGWLIIAPSSAAEELSKQSAACMLSLTPFGTVRSDRILEFMPDHPSQRVRIHRSLPDALKIACAYRLTDTHSEPAIPVHPLMPPTCLKKEGFGGCGERTEGEGFPAWFARTAICPMDPGFDREAIARTIHTLTSALRADGDIALGGASLAIGLEITPTLSRTVLWQYVLRLYHTLRQYALPFLPIAVTHKQTGVSQITFALLARKPYDHHSPELGADRLPLPYCSAAPHTDHPKVLIAYTPTVGSIHAMADTLYRAGAEVQTLQLTPGEQGCTVLANAIDQARLLLLVGGDGDSSLSDILIHDGVLASLRALIARDGLCLAQGNTSAAFYRTGLLPPECLDLLSAAPLDQCDGAFPYPVGNIQDLANPALPARKRPLPSSLPLPKDASSADDPLLSPFRSLQGHPVLAIAETSEGKPVAVRLRGQDGHVLIYADGFDPKQLQAALDYCR